MSLRTEAFWRRLVQPFVGQLVKLTWADDTGAVEVRGELERVLELSVGSSLVIRERSDVPGTSEAVIPLSSLKSLEAL